MEYKRLFPHYVFTTVRGKFQYIKASTRSWQLITVHQYGDALNGKRWVQTPEAKWRGPFTRRDEPQQVGLLLPVER